MLAYYYEGPKSEPSPRSPGVKYSLEGNLVASPEIAGVSRGSQVIHYLPETMWKCFFFFSQFSITAHPSRVLCEKKKSELGFREEGTVMEGESLLMCPVLSSRRSKTKKSPVVSA